MTHPRPFGPTAQLQRLLHGFVLDPAWADSLLTVEMVLDLATELMAEGAEAVVFPPLVVLWMFLTQVLSDDQSCQAAVERLIAWRARHGLPACSSATGGYCRARRRLPEALLHRLVQQTGGRLQDQADPRGSFHGRAVKIIDGTTVSMPDTPENQAAYPQHGRQAPGLGFPLARMVVVLSLATGAILDAAIGPYQGQETGELALLRQLHDRFEHGDIALADRGFGSFLEIALLERRGVDVVMRPHQRRQPELAEARRLGVDDYLINWSKPVRPAWMDQATYATMPEQLSVRWVKVQVSQPGFRPEDFWGVTTLRDSQAFRREEIAELYRARWHAEVCQTDCNPRYRLYPSDRSAHSGRGGAAEPGPMVPGAPTRHPRATAMQRDSERPAPPRPQAA
ncbi:MAG: IS4 family transposase [Planctomycetaceae bacterium]|nr:IS4 family transposase [Planctomycetaceae bacterium]